MKRYLPLLLIALVLAGGVLAWRYHNLTSTSDILSDPDNAAPPTREPNPDPSVPQVAPATTPTTENVAPTFVSFLAAEATSMDSPRIDADLAQKRMEEQAVKLGEHELRYARDLVLGGQYPANQRIVAAAMIGLAGEKGWEAGRRAVTPAFESARAEAHSLEEVKNTQAKALAIMLVDSLAEQARSNPKARDELARWGKEAKDSTIQKHIARKLKELPSL